MPGGLKNFGLRVQGLSYYSPPELDGIWLWLLYSHKTSPHIFHILSTEGGLYLNFGTLSTKGLRQNLSILDLPWGEALSLRCIYGNFPKLGYHNIQTQNTTILIMGTRDGTLSPRCRSLEILSKDKLWYAVAGGSPPQ